MAGENWTTGDEFIAFSFGDFDSKDWGIYRISNGNRYNIDLSPQMNDITADVPGGDGQYFFGTQYKTKNFSVEFVFENLTEKGLSNLKQTFSGKELKELCFSEYPDRVYTAKITGNPIVKVVPFDTNGGTIYKGEGSIQFTAYWPYARTKNYVSDS